MNAHTFSCIIVGLPRCVKQRTETRLCELICSSLQFRLYQYVKDLLGPQGPLVENNGFEPLTPCLQSRCSSQLS